jgi:cytochrome c2
MLLLLALSTGCGESHVPLAAGDARNGLQLLREFGCTSCHVIPGVTAGMGRAAPSLEGIGRRVYLAGILPNSPANLAAWIRSPRSFDPLTAMPDLGVSDSQARDMAAYLGSLR